MARSGRARGRLAQIHTAARRPHARGRRSQDGFTPPHVVRSLAKALDAEYAEFDVAHACNEEPTYTLVTDAVLAFLDTNAA